MKRLKVILLVPVYNCANTLDEWASYIKELNPRPDRIIFCENNSTDGTQGKLRSLDLGGIPSKIITFWTIDPKNKEVFPFPEKCYDVIAWARQLLLDAARKLNPDYAVFVDSDIFLEDPSTLQSLSIWGKDVIGGPYRRVFPEGVYVATLFYVGSPRSNNRGHIKYKKLNPRVLLYEVKATSGGCLCLSRKIIQDRRVNFVPVLPNYSEDFGYCQRARNNGYKIYLDGTITIGHKIMLKWRPWDIARKGNTKRAKRFDNETLIKDYAEEIKKRRKERLRRLQSGSP